VTRVFLAVLAAAVTAGNVPVHFADVTAKAGIHFEHENGAFGGKYLPETMGSGCAFFDYNNDGWPDIILIQGMHWPGHKERGRTTLKLYRNNHNGTFTDVTARAGLDIEMYGMGVAVGDYDNDGFEDLYITAVGQSRLFHNTGKGTFIDVTDKAGLGNRDAFSSSAMWFDYNRDGLLDLFVTNYVKWSEKTDVFCTVDGKTKAYCTPEAYRGATCWLFKNRGNGVFEDVTATSGIFDSTSKGLGVAMLDYDADGWPDVFVSNDTEPNKLYHNLQNGHFEDAALQAGVAFSTDGKARGGMGVDAADYNNSGIPALVIANFDNEMLGFYTAIRRGLYTDQAPQTEIGRRSRLSLGFGTFFFDADLDGFLDLFVANGHIDDEYSLRKNVQYAQPPHLFLNREGKSFVDIAKKIGGVFAEPKVGRGAAFADYDHDGDLDILMTTNRGPAYLFRNDLGNGNKCIRLRLVGTKSNRDAIGATVHLYHGNERASRMVKSGSSYQSQSELTLTFGLGSRDIAERIVINWPSGKTEEYRNLRAGRLYECTEGRGIRDMRHF